MESPKFEIPIRVIKEKAPSEKEPSPKVEKEKKWERFKETEKVSETTIPVSTVASLAEFKPLTEAEITKEIENILSENLEEIYQGLPQNLREQFRKKGDETVSEIKKVISKTKIVIYKILKLIKEWLRGVPGINKFFLEEEAKRKTAKILALVEKAKKKKL